MAIDDKKRFDENYDRIFGKANNEAEKLDDTLDDVVDKTADFLHGVGYCFEDLSTQVYPNQKT